MRIARHFTKAGQSAYETIAFKNVDVVMKNPDGSAVFGPLGVEAPESWAQGGCDGVAQKYFRKAGVTAAL